MWISDKKAARLLEIRSIKRWVKNNLRPQDIYWHPDDEEERFHVHLEALYPYLIMNALKKNWSLKQIQKRYGFNPRTLIIQAAKRTLKRRERESIEMIKDKNG